MNSILKKHYMVIITSIVLCLLALGLVGIVISKMSIRIIKTTGLKEQLLSYQVNKKAFNDESVQINSLQSRLVKLESLITDNRSVPNLLSQLEVLAEKNNNEFEITSVQTPIEGEGTKLVIECTTRGSYDQVMSFFEIIQHQTFQIRLKKLFIFSEQGTTSSAETSGTLPTGKPKKVTTPKEVKWQGVATIEVISFK